MRGQYKGQPQRGGLTRKPGWHGGLSQSIPTEISYNARTNNERSEKNVRCAQEV